MQKNINKLNKIIMNEVHAIVNQKVSDIIEHLSILHTLLPNIQIYKDIKSKPYAKFLLQLDEDNKNTDVFLIYTEPYAITTWNRNQYNEEMLKYNADTEYSGFQGNNVIEYDTIEDFTKPLIERQKILDAYNNRSEIEIQTESVKKLGESIGYGQLMNLASKLWEQNMIEKGYPTSGVFYPYPKSFVKKKYLK